MEGRNIMTTAYLDRLVEARNHAYEEMKKITDKAADEKRDLDAAETESWERANAALDELAVRLKTHIDAEARAAEFDEMFSKMRTPEARNERPSDEARVRQLVNGEVRAVEFKAEARDLVKGTNSAGGYTVPTSFLGRLYEHMTDNSAIRQTNVTVLTTSSGEALQVPKTTGISTAAIVAEAAAISESDPTFGQVTLDAFKYGFISQVSTELIQDTAVDVLGYLARQGGTAIGNGTGTHFVTGDGSSKPNGIVTASTLGVTAAGAAAITTDELIDLMHSVIAPYRRNGSWMMKDSTAAKLRKLKDSTNQYLWQPGLVAGQPDILFGRPVFVDPNMPASTTGLKSILFGDFSTYYIRDVASVRVERSDDFAFNADLATFRFLFRTDGDLIDTTGSVKHLIQA